MHNLKIRLGMYPSRIALIPSGPPDSQSTAALFRPAEAAPLDVDDRALEQVLAKTATTLDALADSRRAHMNEWQQAAVELAIVIAGILTRRQIESGQFPIEDIARELIAACDPEAEVTVRMNPEDYRGLQARTENESAFEGDKRSIRLVEDAELHRGDCRVEDGRQVFLSRFAERLGEIREQLLRSLGHVSA